jgi:hypothetical protein
VNEEAIARAGLLINSNLKISVSVLEISRYLARSYFGYNKGGQENAVSAVALATSHLLYDFLWVIPGFTHDILSTSNLLMNNIISGGEMYYG